MRCLSILLALSCLNWNAFGQQVTSRATLEIILDDAVLLEDFESLSLHSGGSFDVPNPLNSDSVVPGPWNLDVLPGITYESPSGLALYGGFLNGTEDVYLRSEQELKITFDDAQVALGFDLIGNMSGAFYTIDIFNRSDALIETLTIESSQTIRFFGYQAPLEGIKRVRVVHTSFDFIGVNDVLYGLVFQACPAALHGDLRHDFFDVSLFLGYFSDEDDRADLTDDGQFDFFDVSAFLTAFTVGCP